MGIKKWWECRPYWQKGGIIGLIIGVIITNVWIFLFWPFVLAMVLIGMFLGWLIMKKKFVILTIFSILLILFVMVTVIRPLGGKEVPNKPIFKFLCEHQRECWFYIEQDYYTAKATNDKCKRCYPSGCILEHDYGPPAEVGEIIESSQDTRDSAPKVENRIKKYFSSDCEYEMKFIQTDQSKGQCRCGAIITM